MAAVGMLMTYVDRIMIIAECYDHAMSDMWRHRMACIALGVCRAGITRCYRMACIVLAVCRAGIFYYHSIHCILKLACCVGT